MTDTKKEFYIYNWWSGFCIEEEISEIYKIKDNKIFFYNNYCQEYQEADIIDCRKLDNYYINNNT